MNKLTDRAMNIYILTVGLVLIFAQCAALTMAYESNKVILKQKEKHDNTYTNR